MNKTTLPQGLRKLKNWNEKETLKFDLPIQRASGQWNALQKSLLVHSILADYPVPPLYLIKYKAEGSDTLYQALDGKQRCTSLFEFIDGDYALHASTPPAIVEGTEYDLANMHFEDLSEECKDAILGYRFTIYVLEDATDEEIEEAFARLNNSTPLTLIQKARTEMGTDLAEFTNRICRYPFFTQGISLSLAQARRESELEVLLQSMLLMDAKEENYNYKAISMREVMKYCSDIRNIYTEQQRNIILCITEYLSEAFTEKHKLLKKSNVPMVFLMADLAMAKDIVPDGFKKFIDYFSDNIPVQYEENMGSGNIKRAKTEGRLVAMYESMKKYFDFADDTLGFPLYVGKTDTETSAPEENEEPEIGEVG